MKTNKRLGSLMTLAAAGALMFPAGMASAAPHGSTALTCTGGDIASGTYSSITVAGACAVPAGATVMITGNLNVLSGAMLDADSAPSTITVGHNVVGYPGSSTGLGKALMLDDSPHASSAVASHLKPKKRNLSSTLSAVSSALSARCVTTHIS